MVIILDCTDKACPSRKYQETYKNDIFNTVSDGHEVKVSERSNKFRIDRIASVYSYNFKLKENERIRATPNKLNKY